MTNDSPAPPSDVARRLEAILLIVEEPQSLVSLATAVGAPVPAVRQAIEALVEDYDGLAGGPRRGFELREVGGGWRLYVREEHDDLVTEFVNTQAPSRLSQAALETLAVIAYKQPVSRAQVAAIRGVDPEGVVRTLQSRGYITEVARDPGPGQAVLWGTTPLFLERLGLDSLADLPPLAEFVPGADVVEALEEGLRVVPPTDGA
jgi:segregation and condensation protein B